MITRTPSNTRTLPLSYWYYQAWGVIVLAPDLEICHGARSRLQQQAARRQQPAASQPAATTTTIRAASGQTASQRAGQSARPRLGPKCFIF